MESVIIYMVAFSIQLERGATILNVNKGNWTEGEESWLKWTGQIDFLSFPPEP